MKPKGWVSHPDDVERLVAQWQQEYPDLLAVEQVRQFTGRPVFALILGDASSGGDRTEVILEKSHAHEPAPCAAMMNLIAKLLSGRGLDGEPPPLDRDAVLQSLTLTFLPDVNPGGTERAPVKWWDGTQYTNEEFWMWMRGLNRETGRMWERYDKWDLREVDPRPATIGIVYEQVSEYEYVEPNRHHDSSLFRLLFRLMETHSYSLLMSLHQTEFVGQMEDAMVLLPILFDEQPEWIQKKEMEIGHKMIEWWDRVGGRPMKKIAPLGYSGMQADYFRRAWGNLYSQMPCVTSEVRNNSLLCPPSQQRTLSEAAAWAGIEMALRWHEQT
ncbi:MAG: M14 family zinc carboxypeptidase [Armatimonadota bacterium]